MSRTQPPQAVWIRQTAPGRLRRDVMELVEEAGLRDAFDPRRKTLIKINGNVNRYYPGSNTSRWMLDALLTALRTFGFRDVIACEGDLPDFSADRMIRNTKLLPILDTHGVPFLNYERLERNDQRLPRIIVESQLINLPTMHTHGFAVISCATKNLWGLLPVDRRHYHHVLSEKMLDLYQSLPMFNVVDGTVGMYGDSTRTGLPLRADLVFAGWDSLSLDCVAAKVMGFRQAQIPLLEMARDRGLVHDPIDVRGEYSWETLPSIHFEFRRGLLRRMTMWLEALSTRHPIARGTAAVLHWGPVDRLYNIARVIYVNTMYARLKEKLVNGPWMEYERPLGSVATGAGAARRDAGR